MSWRATHGLDARRAARTLARGAIALKQQLDAELARLLAGGTRTTSPRSSALIAHAFPNSRGEGASFYRNADQLASRGYLRPRHDCRRDRMARRGVAREKDSLEPPAE